MSRAYRDVLAVPGARTLIGASAASQIGNWLYNAALLEALEAAPTLRPALDLSSTAPGVQVPPGETSMVDDPRWVEK